MDPLVEKLTRYLEERLAEAYSTATGNIDSYHSRLQRYETLPPLWAGPDTYPIKLDGDPTMNLIRLITFADTLARRVNMAPPGPPEDPQTD